MKSSWGLSPPMRKECVTYVRQWVIRKLKRPVEVVSFWKISLKKVSGENVVDDDDEWAVFSFVRVCGSFCREMIMMAFLLVSDDSIRKFIILTLFSFGSFKLNK